VAEEVHTEAHGQVAEPHERLDPETRARRAAALKHVRKYGDPVLRSRALEIERFDEALVQEVRRMGQLMHDSYGIGLAATQVGVMNRVLVYRTELEGSIAALVNPVLEWASKDKESSEEGCLSLPGVGVDVERPVHVRVRALDEYGNGVLVEASGLEARVIQHEMDHLDGVLILDRTSRDQRKQAMKTLREQLEATAA
jgi:peptide deformylase